MTTQVLIVHGQLSFAIKLKQSLERSTSFEAHPFTSIEAAVDYLRDHIQDIALVDFAMPGAPGEQIVRQLRSIQPNIALVATPKLDGEQMKALGIAGSFNAGFSARDMINTINNYFAQKERPSYQNPSGTALLARLETRPAQTQEPLDLPDYVQFDDMMSDPVGTNIFEPPREEGDTPPSGVNELVWEEEPPPPESAFDEVLNSLPDTPESVAPNSPFDDLVNSMRTDEAHRPLPSRQQQLVEFILGTDSLSEQDKNAPSEPEPPEEPEETPKSGLLGAFERLSQEEPPQPDFEESGTVSDLISGVQGRGFQNVLSMLAGEEVSEDNVPEEEEIAPPTSADFAATPRREPGAPRQPETYDFDKDDEPTPAKVILQRTLEQSMTGGTFSLEELLANIDAQLPLHRPKVQPLPSWLHDQQRAQDDAFLVQEPDFLPEELPYEPTPIEASENLYPDQVTKPARGQQIEEHPEALETDWIELPHPAAEESFDFPDTLPEEFPADATLVHPESDEATIVNEALRFDEEIFPADEAFAPAEAVPSDEEAIPDDWFSFDEEIMPDEADLVEEEPFPELSGFDEEIAPDEAALFGETRVSGEPEPAEFDEVAWLDETFAAADLAFEKAAADEAAAPEEEAVFDQAAIPEEEEVAAEPEVSEELSGLWYDLPEQDFNTQFEMMAAFEVHDETGVTSRALYTEVPIEPVEAEPEPVPEPVAELARIEDPHLAQLALSLTEVSLELTAEATLLARDGQIVAFAGQMPQEEVEELRGAIADDWDAAPGEVRIRFITAEDSGKDYMLYSRRTEDDFTLSLIFAGTTPLRDIRRQGKRLVDALLSVPEMPPATMPEETRVKAVEPVADGATRTPYACVWLLRDPKAHLDDAVSQAITSGLNVQMREKQWTIQSLQVHEDYVYMLADVPGEEPAYKIIRDLKRRSAEIAHAQNAAYTPDGLWADSYLIVTPGRELDVEEIQQFINFDRM